MISPVNQALSWGGSECLVSDSAGLLAYQIGTEALEPIQFPLTLQAAAQAG